MKKFTFWYFLNLLFMLCQILFFAHVIKLAYQDGSHELKFGGPPELQYVVDILLQYVVPAIYAGFLAYLLSLSIGFVTLSPWQHFFLFVFTILTYFLMGEIIAICGMAVLYMMQRKKMQIKNYQESF